MSDSAFSGVMDTLYIPLWARIYVSKKFPHYFFDPKALELEAKIPEELRIRKSNQYQQLANVSCYFNMDRIVKSFIEQRGEVNIVNLGCGLETNRWRIADPRATFYELDFPEVIKKRLALLGESEKEVLLPFSMLDYAWVGHIDKNRPTLLTARGVFEYFHKEEVLAFLMEIRKRIPKAEVVFDCPSSKGVAYANSYVKKTGNQNALIYFYVDDADSFAKEAQAEIRSAETFYVETRKVLKKGLSLYTRIAMKVVDKGGMGKVIHIAL